MGLKTAPTVQLAPGASCVLLHPSLPIPNSPYGATLVTSRVAAVGFLTVIVLEALVAPARILPKFVVAGVIVSLPATPTPLSAADPALLFAESLTARVEACVPSALGVKVNVTVQLVQTASVEPQPLFVIVNSSGSAPLS